MNLRNHLRRLDRLSRYSHEQLQSQVKRWIDRCDQANMALANEKIERKADVARLKRELAEQQFMIDEILQARMVKRIENNHRDRRIEFDVTYQQREQLVEEVRDYRYLPTTNIVAAELAATLVDFQVRKGFNLSRVELDMARDTVRVYQVVVQQLSEMLARDILAELVKTGLAARARKA